MQVNFENVGFRYRRLIKKIYNRAVEYTNNDLKNSIITVSFASEEKIREYNNEFRKVDKITDVLSFPMLDIHYSEKLKDFIKETTPNGVLYIGDVVICLKVARRQAKEYKHSLVREVAFLALHGLLHVLGYDHIEKEDEVIMQKAANDILDSLNIKRKQ